MGASYAGQGRRLHKIESMKLQFRIVMEEDTKSSKITNHNWETTIIYYENMNHTTATT
jgi:hypothetical protein